MFERRLKVFLLMITLFDFALTLGVFAGALVVMLLLRHGLFRALYKRAGTKAKSVFLDALKFPSFLWALAAALEIALRYAKLTERQVSLAETWIDPFFCRRPTIHFKTRPGFIAAALRSVSYRRFLDG